MFNICTRIISSKLQQKNIVVSFKPYTEKIKKKKIGICSILGRIRIRIHHPGSVSADPDPDPHQNDTDPKHWKKGLNHKLNIVIH